MLSIIKLNNEMITIFIIYSRIGSNGTILNHQLNTVNPNINKIVKIIASNSLKTEIGKWVSSLFLDLESVNNSIIPHIPVAITHKLE